MNLPGLRVQRDIVRSRQHCGWITASAFHRWMGKASNGSFTVASEEAVVALKSGRTRDRLEQGAAPAERPSLYRVGRAIQFGRKPTSRRVY